jgi:hypothetical protein
MVGLLLRPAPRAAPSSQSSSPGEARLAERGGKRDRCKFESVNESIFDGFIGVAASSNDSNQSQRKTRRPCFNFSLQMRSLSR